VDADVPLGYSLCAGALVLASIPVARACGREGAAFGRANGPHFDSRRVLLAARVNSTLMAGENLTVGSTVWLPAESVAPGR